MSREPINVAASIIADVSAGIYRTPAGALKELVSNAFDADASTARISTGWPEFRTFTCTDDGNGMTPGQFKSVMSHIGGSTKRDQGETSAKGRPLVGRIGIGFLSVAQICKRFQVISSVAGKSRKFSATIDLDPFSFAEAKRAKLGSTIEKDGDKVRIGDYEIEEADEKEDSHYTRIVMERIDSGFRQRLRDAPQIRGGITPRQFTRGTIGEFLDAVEQSTVAEHGAYAQMIWEMAATAPVEYLDDGPVLDEPSLDYLRKRHQDFQFKAFVDGVELRKPIRLPPIISRPIEHRVYAVTHSRILSDKRRFDLKGYLYWQKGRVLPRELQGVLVRVRNVAIGTYDPTYLAYPHHEGWKFSQMTGELYVDDGLDAAVNIDRSSFRESDEAFIELQGFLFERLKGGTDEGAGIFTAIKSETKKLARQVREKEERRKDRVAARAVGSRARKLKVVAAPVAETQSGVAVAGASIQVGKDILKRVPKKAQRLFIAICAVVEREIGKDLSAHRRRGLYERLAGLFEEF